MLRLIKLHFQLYLMIARCHIVVGFIDSLKESQCEIYDTIVQCIALILRLLCRRSEEDTAVRHSSYERYAEVGTATLRWNRLS